MGGRQRAKGERGCSVIHFQKLHEVMIRFCALHLVREISPQIWCVECRILHCNRCCPGSATR